MGVGFKKTTTTKWVGGLCSEKVPITFPLGSLSELLIPALVPAILVWIIVFLAMDESMDILARPLAKPQRCRRRCHTSYWQLLLFSPNHPLSTHLREPDQPVLLWLLLPPQAFCPSLRARHSGARRASSQGWVVSPASDQPRLELRTTLLRPGLSEPDPPRCGPGPVGGGLSEPVADGGQPDFNHHNGAQRMAWQQDPVPSNLSYLFRLGCLPCHFLRRLLSHIQSRQFGAAMGGAGMQLA